MDNKESFLDKYRYVIIVVLILVIVSGWIYLYLNKSKSKNYDDDIAVINQKISDMQNKINSQQVSTQVAGATAEQPTEVSVSNKINLNTADISQLDTLSGIGPSKAQDIIDYRNANGDFETIEQIQNVKGIGQATFEKIKDNISVE